MASDNDICGQCHHYRRWHNGPGGMCRWEQGAWACKCGHFHNTFVREPLVP